MKVIKRNGSEVDFDISKIEKAITKANNAGRRRELTEEQIREASEYICYKCEKMKRAVSVEEIQDMVENQIMAHGAFEIAKGYVKYRYTRSLVRSPTPPMTESFPSSSATTKKSFRKTPTKTLS